MEPNVRSIKKLSTPIHELSDDFEISFESEKSLKHKLKCLEKKLSKKEEIIKQYELKMKKYDEKLSQAEEVAKTVEIYKNRLNNSIREINGVRIEFSNYLKTLADVKKEKTLIENEIYGYKLYFIQTKTMFQDLENKFEESQHEYEKKIEKLNGCIKSLKMKFFQPENLPCTQNVNELKSNSSSCNYDSDEELKLKSSDVFMHSSRQSMKISSNLDIVQEVREENEAIDSMSEMMKLNSKEKTQCEENQQTFKLNTKLDSNQPKETAKDKKKVKKQKKFKGNFTKLLSFAHH
ncbi:hypothetical protein PVAND_013906 [Polypedilum vanderplanki]|uniref:Uncharacterized protein n=1 Tax=Polypedilum vanderplanki TaxID=319348 RepID=A0A9J6CR47_POLVA|nr:hypothetical protein PVAND_013906 [Polypedilum vanderplanki]